MSAPGDHVSAVNRPGAIIRWWPVILLALLYIISFIDRLILSILVAPLQRELGISDTQVALLIGSTFGLFYAAVGIPIAWAIDRGNRLLIGVGGITLWSVCTVASGLVAEFETLLVQPAENLWHWRPLVLLNETPGI